MDVHRAARVMAAGHGGQVLISSAARDLLDERFTLRDLGPHRLKDLSAPQHLFQLGEGEFPPPEDAPSDEPSRSADTADRPAGGARAGECTAAREPPRDARRPGGLREDASRVAARRRRGRGLRGRCLLGPAPGRRRSQTGRDDDRSDGWGERRRCGVPSRAQDAPPPRQPRAPARRRARAGRAAPGNVTGEVARDEPRAAQARRRAALPSGAAAGSRRGHVVRRARPGGRSRVCAEPCRPGDLSPRSMGFRSHSSSRRPASRCSRPRTCSLGSTARCRCSPVARGMPRRDSERFARRSSGATPYSARRSSAPSARSSIFAGSFDLDAAVAVCDADLDTLQSLVDKSLVRRWGSGRFGHARDDPRVRTRTARRVR